MNRSQNRTAMSKMPSSKHPAQIRRVLPGRPTTAAGGFPRSALLVVAVVLALAPLRALAEGPAAPVNLRAEFESGDIFICWDHPGDPHISGYDWRFRFAKVDFWTPDWTVLPTADSDTVSVGLGTRYGAENAFEFQLRARNADGHGSATSVDVVPPPRP